MVKQLQGVSCSLHVHLVKCYVYSFLTLAFTTWPHQDLYIMRQQCSRDVPRGRQNQHKVKASCSFLEERMYRWTEVQVQVYLELKISIYSLKGLYRHLM